MNDSSRDSRASPVGLPVLAGRVGRPPTTRTGPASSTPDSSNVSRTAAHTSARAVASSAPSRAAHSAGAGPAQADRVVEVARVDPAAGKDAHARRERHRGLAPQQVDLRTCRRPRPQQHHRRRVARLGRRQLARGVRPRLLDEVGRQRDPQHRGAQTSTTSSTSTGTSSGSAATPTADRACLPASPNTSPSSSEAPLATLGCAVKSGVDATKTTTLTTRLIADELADLGLDRGERVEGALPRALVALLLGHLVADLAGRQHRAVARAAAGRP